MKMYVRTDRQIDGWTKINLNPPTHLKVRGRKTSLHIKHHFHLQDVIKGSTSKTY